MQQAQRENIEKNLQYLIDNLNNFDQVLNVSDEKKLLDQNDLIELKDKNISLDEKKRIFFTKCLNKGVTVSFNMKLMGVLLKSGNGNIWDKINRNDNQPLDETDLQSQNDQRDETYINKLTPIDEIKVKSAIIPYSGQTFHAKPTYKMDSKPRGYALILVNEFFDVPKFKRLIGAVKDLDLMTQLLKQMGYETVPCKDQTKPEFEKTVKNFISNSDWKNVDSCIVAISSHGTSEGFACRDGEIYLTEQLKAAFNNVNCSQLRGKPKMFIIDACRGNKADLGVSIATKDEQIPKIASISDTFVFRSCQDGYVSYISQKEGSVLFNSIVDVFMNFACQDELKELTRKVHEKIDHFTPPNGEQAADSSTNGTFKYLYFNPGF